MYPFIDIPRYSIQQLKQLSFCPSPPPTYKVGRDGGWEVKLEGLVV